MECKEDFIKIYTSLKFLPEPLPAVAVLANIRKSKL